MNRQSIIDEVVSYLEAVEAPVEYREFAILDDSAPAVLAEMAELGIIVIENGMVTAGM